jgi:hypothetical protein
MKNTFEKCRFLSARDSMKIEECKIERGKYVVVSLGPFTCFLGRHWMIEGHQNNAITHLYHNSGYQFAIDPALNEHSEQSARRIQQEQTLTQQQQALRLWTQVSPGEQGRL